MFSNALKTIWWFFHTVCITHKNETMLFVSSYYDAGLLWYHFWILIISIFIIKLYQTSVLNYTSFIPLCKKNFFKKNIRILYLLQKVINIIKTMYNNNSVYDLSICAFCPICTTALYETNERIEINAEIKSFY